MSATMRKDPDGTTINDAYPVEQSSSESADESDEKSTAKAPPPVPKPKAPAALPKSKYQGVVSVASSRVFKSPTGLTVTKRKRTPNSGGTSVSAMSSPSPKVNKPRRSKVAGVGSAKAAPKKKTTKGKKHQLKTAPPLPAKDVAKAVVAAMSPPAQGPEEEKGEDTSTVPPTRSDPLPFAQHMEARVDGEYKSGADINFNSDSDDEEDWEGNLGEEEYNDHLGKTREDFSVKPDYLSSDIGSTNTTEIEDAPPGWKPHGPKPDWKPSKPKKSEGEPAFKDVDNPGKWPPFVFRSKFRDGNRKLEYQRHMLMTGCTPVPAVKSGPYKDQRVRGSWTFNYEGTWVSDKDYVSRDGADEDNMFPKCRRGKLCVVTLKKLGMTKERMAHPLWNGKPDALFFEQLILPMCDIEKSGIEDDPRMPFYHPCSVWTNSYATGELHLGSGCGHDYKNCTAAELVHWDGVIQMDGALGGSNGAIYRRWDETTQQYNKLIADAMGITRFKQLKACWKLCNNHAHPKRGEEGYDPTYKFDCIWKVQVHNINAITEKAEDDQSLDESTWAYGGFAEGKSGIISAVDKPGTTRGGQVVVTSDVHRPRIRAYLHRHKLHEKVIKGHTCGANEVYNIFNRFERLLISDDQPANDPRRKVKSYDRKTFKSTPEDKFLPRGIFRKKPHTTCDNFFSGDNIQKYAAEHGFGMTNAVARGVLPKDVEDKYMHKLGTASQDPRARAARWIQPVVMHKKYKKSNVVHVTFQSTSSCNITSVNGVNSCRLYAETKVRGKGDRKRTWGIEMNQVRRLYLGSYQRIDTIDHQMANMNMSYVSHKYWHSPMNHGKKMAKLMAYDVYLECSEGNLDPAWKCEPVAAADFHEQLSKQKLAYDPCWMVYPGDNNMRKNTRLPKKDRMPNQGSQVGQPLVWATPSKKRKVPYDPSVCHTVTSLGISAVDLNKAMPRFCGNLDQLIVHVKAHGSFPNGNTRECLVCAGDTTTYCGICGAPLHYLTLHKKAQLLKVPCYFWYHNPSFFGGCACDAGLCGDEKSVRLVTTPEQRKNAEEIRRLLQSESSGTITTTTTGPDNSSTHSDNARAALEATRAASAALANASNNNDNTEDNVTNEELLARAATDPAASPIAKKNKGKQKDPSNYEEDSDSDDSDSDDDGGGNGVEVVAVEKKGCGI